MTTKVTGPLLADGVLSEIDTLFTPGNYTRVAADGSIEQRTPAQVRTDIGATGTVSSVNLANSTGLTASGGPITGSGSLTYTLSANLQAWHGLATSAKQDADATLTALAGANWVANSLPIGSGADTVAQVTFGANTFPGRSSTGNLVAKPISDNAFGILNGQLDSGTYTPTLTGVANVDTATPQVTAWFRVGSVVTVAGLLDVDTTAAGSTLTQLRISLPVASALTTIFQCSGTASASASVEPGFIAADAANDAAIMNFNSLSTGSRTMAFHFSYRVL